MKYGTKAVTILMADDDADACILVKEAFEESRFAYDFRMVENDEALMDYLNRRGKYTDAPRPELILLDLNMPKKDGPEALREIKADPLLRTIPIIILTTSREEEHVFRSYSMGANSFVTKPVTYEGLLKVIRLISAYWFQIVELPPAAEEVQSEQ